ncbi:chorismate pyruvate-lyase family protein [Longirhabdus pacifica]|uniref:chorismate pyruvate-lyase family protein n=1 Tax=Longirhabdus pacifica TaxID=2305227 RepID=UPI0013E8E262|nr:chorismate pyruvate-lyase family protein [Longirhabdus pacifica]
MNKHTLPDDNASRMLLQSDGSTTQLLESMLNEPLDVIVVKQEMLQSYHIDPTIAALLRIPNDENVLERYSQLVTKDNTVVSNNYVVCRLGLDANVMQKLHQGSIPIGKIWSSNRLSGHRMLLGYGQEFHDKEQRQVPYKHYIQWHDDVPRLYIREKFNPAYVKIPC